MKVKFELSTGFAGCRHEDIIEFDDDITEDEIESEFKDWVWEQIDGHWEIQGDGNG